MITVKIIDVYNQLVTALETARICSFNSIGDWKIQLLFSFTLSFVSPRFREREREREREKERERERKRGTVWFGFGIRTL